MKNKLNQPDVEQSTTLEPNTSITIGAWTTSTSINTHMDTQRIIPIPHKLDKPNPIEEVKKEWEEKGWKIDEDWYFKTITFIKGDRGIEFNIEEKSYFTFQPEVEYNSFKIDLELHTLIGKTLKVLEVKNAINM